MRIYMTGNDAGDRSVVKSDCSGPKMRLAELHHAVEIFVIERGDGETEVEGLEWHLAPSGDFEIRVKLSREGKS